MKKICSLKDKFEIAINPAVSDVLDAASAADVFVVEDYPKTGVNFVDISSIFLQPKVFKNQIEAMKRLILTTLSQAANYQYDYILGIESRGFLYASVLSYELGIPLVLVRKKGKLPRNTVSAGYEKEYGTDYLEITTDDIAPNSSVLIVDDVLATGGTLEAVARLLKSEFKVKQVSALVAYLLDGLVKESLFEVMDEVMMLSSLRA